MSQRGEASDCQILLRLLSGWQRLRVIQPTWTWWRICFPGSLGGGDLKWSSAPCLQVSHIISNAPGEKKTETNSRVNVSFIGSATPPRKTSLFVSSMWHLKQISATLRKWGRVCIIANRVIVVRLLPRFLLSWMFCHFPGCYCHTLTA